jgi:FdhD protein
MPPIEPPPTAARLGKPGPRRPDRSRTAVEIHMLEGRSAQLIPDELATEEPLEIRLRLREPGETEPSERPVAVTMRTPGAEPRRDAELAAGFLYGEGVVRRAEEIHGFTHRSNPMPGPTGSRGENIVVVELAGEVSPDLGVLDRHFYTSSACGVCGKASLDALLLGKNPALPPGPVVSPELLYRLPERLRTAQGVFRATGGLHAAGLFTAGGELLAVREDVGRHNALDKLFGWALLSGRLPLHDHVVLVSGRTSYEILQKCLMAEVPLVCAVSAPSSLAVSLARRFGITLVGFLRGERLNVYAGFERVRV